jgi:anti-sigma factor RsiW
MKTFEEKWTAWVDDQLTGEELARFEASLPDKAAAEAEKRAAKTVGALLQRELAPKPLRNADFFSHQIRQQIDRDEHDFSETPADAGFFSFWPIRRLALVGATSLAIFVGIAVFVMQDKQPAEPSQYLTQIIGAKLDPASGPDATMTIFESKEDRVTVLWTEGLKSLPAEYASK